MDEALDALRAAAKREYEVNGVDKPGLEFELNVIMLEDTEEYRDSGIFSRVYPGDTARFIHDEDGLDVKARMTGYTWQPSTEEYLTQSYYSSAALRGGTDIEHKIDNIGNQITVIDQTTIRKAANNSNTVGWSSDVPPENIKGTKEGALWYQQVGIHVIMWMWHDGAWIQAVSDIAGQDATNIIGGTFNAANVNVINLNANSIVTGHLSANRIQAGSISGNNLDINLDSGAVMFKKGYLSGANDRIRLDMDNSYLRSMSSSNNGFEIKNGTMTFYQNFFSGSKNEIGSVNYDVLSTTQGGIRLVGKTGATLVNSSNSAWVSVGDSRLNSGDQHNLGFMGNAYFWGNLQVLGSKNAAQITRDGIRATPAYETAESYLGDIGEGTTDGNKMVTVPIETLFGDMVNTMIPYQVFLQSYSSAHVWVSSRDAASFVVESDRPNAAFSWEIKAKRRGFENNRLVKSKMSIEEYAKKVDGMESDKDD